MPVNQASEVNRLWWVRAQNWSEGAGQTPYETRARTQEIVDASEAKHRAALAPGEKVLGDPHNFHSNPGYMNESTASSLVQSAPGGIYRTPGPRAPIGSAVAGHRPMALGGRRREPTPGRTIVPASGARQPESEGGPLSVTMGYPGR